MELLYFTSPKCGICHALKPKVERLLQNEFPNVEFKEVPIENIPELIGQYLIFTAPAILLNQEDKELFRIAGPMGIQQIRDGLVKALRTE